MIEKHDRTVLRELAHRVAEIAADPAQEERKALWRSINSLKRCRIPVLLRVNSLYIDEVMPESLLQTADPIARRFRRRSRLGGRPRRPDDVKMITGQFEFSIGPLP